MFLLYGNQSIIAYQFSGFYIVEVLDFASCKIKFIRFLREHVNDIIKLSHKKDWSYHNDPVLPSSLKQGSYVIGYSVK